MADFQLSDGDRVKIASNFICLTPPGEFVEVFNDIRILLNNDTLLKEKGGNSFAKYNKDQFTPVKLTDERSALISHHSQLPDGRFFDPTSRSTFKYDHLRREVSDIRKDWSPNQTESYREAVDKETLSYINEHFTTGAATVFGTVDGNNFKIVLCIENHKFSSTNFWNARWRSEWNATFTPRGAVEVKGILKVQVHYYEAGNVQLVSSKEIKDRYQDDGEPAFAKKLVEIIRGSETHFQEALNENYRTMNSTTFKALRRALPITHTKLDWLKIKGMTVENSFWVFLCVLYLFYVIDEFSGKTAVIRRYTEASFTPNYKLTIGVDFSSRSHEWDNDTRVTLQLWDIAGHERYGQMTRVYYKYAHAAIIVFDQTRTASFDSVLKWYSDVKEKVVLSNNQHVPVLLLANKSDLKDQLEVDLTHMNDFLQMHDFIGWFRTSAKDNLNIDEAMQFLLDHVMTTQSDPAVRPVTPSDPNSTFTLSNSYRVHSDTPIPLSGKTSNSYCCSNN
ncbi:F-actin-capping protein subunit alpha [Oopsacas minuta]|uniref:F-actin-capping protein subunit alpha n=1 Tax=Oopsacas minuta TaxID=111878 RepID=A0AAV7KAQ7_9METZ|nr:F-actin-capping protein subunit alpha [Oopsacas minuta]